MISSFCWIPVFGKPAALKANYKVIPNSIHERIRFYNKNKGRFTTVFCFANTPPPVKLDVPSYTYLHNQKLLDARMYKLNRSNLALYIKYLFIRLFNKNTDYYIVQTPHMVAETIKAKLKDKGHCLILPFYDDEKYKEGHVPFDLLPKDEFVFVSTPSPQKNYPSLFDAWEYLLSLGHMPKLHVTVDNTAPLLSVRMDELNAKGARIVNHVYIDPKELYYKCRYLIFPSLVESFGLPLVEAVDCGMKVLASDLPFVTDVIVPSITFDPYDKTSIADAVLKAQQTDLPPSTIVTSNKIDELLALLTR